MRSILREITTEEMETNVLVLNMLQELQFTVGALAQYRRAEGLHDLLDRHRGACELVLRRALMGNQIKVAARQGSCAYHTRPKAPIQGK